MNSSFTTSGSESFSITNARKLASKVATDLKRFQRFYGGVPIDLWIERYERELVELLKRNALTEVTYGFRRNGLWTPAVVRYRAFDGALDVDDDPGRVPMGVSVTGAAFSSFCETNANYSALSAAELQQIVATAGFSRTNGTSPALEAGYWTQDRTYSSGGRGLGRSTVRQ
jgi:hypothetical protein